LQSVPDSNGHTAWVALQTIKRLWRMAVPSKI
jgi:hypothetical protein